MFVHQGGEKKKNGDFSMFQAVSITSTWNSRGWNNFGLLHGEWNLGTLQMGKKKLDWNYEKPEPRKIPDRILSVESWLVNRDP